MRAVQPVRRTALLRYPPSRGDERPPTARLVIGGLTPGGGCRGEAEGAAAPTAPGRDRCPAAPDQGARPLHPVSAAATLCQAVEFDLVYALTQGRPRRPEAAIMRPLR